MPATIDIADTYSSLTKKQHETLELVADGRTHKEIASALDISVSAATQRIETLRAKFGGCTKAELARIHRSRSDAATYKESTGKTSHLFAAPPNGQTGQRQHGDSPMSFADSAPVFRLDAPWQGMEEPHVVPEVLDGDEASTFRWVAVIGIAGGLLALVILVLAAAQAIGSLG